MIHKIGRRFFRWRAASLIFFNRADVAESLKGKGIPSQKIDTLAAAIVARVNGQQLTNTQRSVLSFELGRPSVQKVINELIQKKTNGIDSTQSAVYDDSNIRDGLTDEEKTALWDLAHQRVGVFSSHAYAPATEALAIHQSQNVPSEDIFEGDADVSDNILTDGSHLENGKLKPNVTYKTGEHDYFYTTNEDGLIVSARTDDLQLKKHERRHKHNPNTYGKEPGDHAGHLIGDRFGGSPELDNLVSQAENVNKREYRKIEERWAKALKNGQKVTVNIDIHYDGGGVRPSSFDVTYTIDGVQHKQKIRNQ